MAVALRCAGVADVDEDDVFGAVQRGRVLGPDGLGPVPVQILPAGESITV